MPLAQLHRPSRPARHVAAPASAGVQRRPHLLSRQGVLDLQATAGNRAVQRALVTEERDDVAPSGANPLAGLKRQDGLDFGTFDKRPRVKLLQTKLNEKVGSALAPDGMWGAKTSSALETFQLSRSTVPSEFVDEETADALMDRGGGGGGGVDPVPPAPVVDPEVDALLDQILLQYSRLHVAQSKAVTQVERDLRGAIETAPDPLFVQAVKFAADKVLESLLGPGAGSFRTAIKQGLAFVEDLPASDQLTSLGVDKPFDAAKDGAKRKIAEELTNPGETEPLSAFVGTQLNALAEATLESQSALVEAKPELRKQPKDRVQKLLAEVQKQTAEAPERQYETTVSRWAQANAQKTLGVTQSGADPLDPAGTSFVEGLEGRGVNEVPGVLEIDINFDDDQPKRPVTVNELTIAGLSPKVREHLNAQNPKLRDLNFPSRASGDSQDSVFGLGSRLSVARAEDKKSVTEIASHGSPVSGTTSGGHEYIEEKGDGNGFAGIERLFAEIDDLAVTALGGLKAP